MNAMNKLLAILDEVYGFSDQSKSKLRTVSRTYDEKSNSHIVTFQYITRRKKDNIVSNKIRENSLLSALLK